MESEQAIAERLKGNIPQPVEPKPAASTPVITDEPSGITAGMELDDLMQYKLHEYFGESYKTSDEKSKSQVAYIYQQIADLIGTTEYGHVVAQLHNLERMLGIASSDNRLFRVYQWLRLDKARRNIEAEMGALTE